LTRGHLVARAPPPIPARPCRRYPVARGIRHRQLPPFSLFKMRVTFSLFSLLVALSSSPVFARHWEPFLETDDFGEHVVVSIETTSIRTTEGQISSPLAISCPSESLFNVYPSLVMGLPYQPSLRDYGAESDFRRIMDMILKRPSSKT